MTSYAAACCCSVDPEPVCDSWATMSYDYSISMRYTDTDSDIQRSEEFDFTMSGVAKMLFSNTNGRFSTATIPNILQDPPSVTYRQRKNFISFGSQVTTSRDLDTSRPVGWIASARHGFGLAWNFSGVQSCNVALDPTEYGLLKTFRASSIPYTFVSQFGNTGEGEDEDATGYHPPSDINLIGEEELPCEQGEMVYQRGSWNPPQSGTRTLSLPNDCDVVIPGDYSATDGTQTFSAQVSWSMGDLVFYDVEPPP